MDLSAAGILARLPESTMRLGLERIQAACDALGRPQSAFRWIHVAGTNGKGSTCAMLDAALRRAGKRVGFYSSPHLVSFNERIRIDGEPISDEALDASMRRLWDAGPFVRDPSDPSALTYFEAATALAFDAFAHAGVEIAVVEVGLGGRLDATNLEGKDLLAAVVSRIARDHTAFLGEDLADIAREKGAIARPDRPLVLGTQEPRARAAIARQAAEMGARLFDVEAETSLKRTAEGLVYRGPRWELTGLRLGLLGPHQEENARLALAVLELLGVSPEAAREGLSRARWPGRLQVVSERPLVVLDGAHNPDGARALARAWQALWPERKPHLVFGVLSDKDAREMTGALFPLAETVQLCAPASGRAVSSERLAELFGGTPHDSVEAALRAALRQAGRDGAVLVCGSLYLVGEALRILGA